MKTYNELEAQPVLETLSGWTFDTDGIKKSFEFTNFVQAMGFISQLAIVAEKADHHPELFNVYNKVDVRLSTHDAGGLTDKDFSLARQIEALI
ncbi:MAG: 4a-hydroxytetrahydrobiopterin dehydratase [Bacteroidota bacterium]